MSRVQAVDPGDVSREQLCQMIVSLSMRVELLEHALLRATMLLLNGEHAIEPPSDKEHASTITELAEDLIQIHDIQNKVRAARTEAEFLESPE